MLRVEDILKDRVEDCPAASEGGRNLYLKGLRQGPRRSPDGSGIACLEDF